MSSKSLLIDFDGRRDNNFTVIRITLAWLVLYGHSYKLQKTPGISDPLLQLFQGSLWIGELAVNGFFAISGFLVAGSIIKRGLVDYTISRALRIFPALIVCVFALVFILGPLATTLSLDEYFSSSKTYDYLTNAIAFMKMEWRLPGVFESNYKKGVNGSLWTLTVEVYCYTLLAITAFFGLLKHRFIANLFLIGLLLFSLSHFSLIPLIGHHHKWSRPAMYFLLGVFIYINRANVLLDTKLAVLALIISIISFGEVWFNYVFPVTFVYLIFYAAYKTKYIHLDDKIGDISYGMYIYAFPVQQLIAFYLPTANPYVNTVLSTMIVIPIAWLSWHKIEKPMLSLKHKVANSNLGFSR